MAKNVKKGKYKTTKTVTLRKSASSKAKKQGSVPKGTVISVVDYGKTWSKVNYGSKTLYCESKYLEKYNPKSVFKTKSEASKIINGKYNNSKNNLKSLMKSNNMTGIYGMPYQFMSNVDMRIPGTKFGEIYSEDIVADMPLLMITPGEPHFLSGFSNTDKKNLTKVISSALKSGKTNKKQEKAISSLLSDKDDSRRYYTFKFDYTGYYNYVNPMLWNCALYLGIGNEKITIGNQKSKALKEFNWSKAYNKLKNYTFQQQFISFYLDSENSIQESFSNQTTQSAIADGLNSTGATANEIKFLQGAVLGIAPKNYDKDESYKKAVNDINDLNKKYFKGSSVVQNLINGAATVASGGKLLFPEIWSDSNYTKSYDISIKLRTPDCDKVSWYLNICVPLMHLVALAAPRQISGNGYTSPFLVRAFYKGLFNVDMGMIDQLSITRGRESAWTVDGLPTEVDITMSIKDLYDALFISGFKNKDGLLTGLVNSVTGNDTKYILKNTGMMDYLASTCGIDVNKPEMKRTMEMFSTLYKNGVKTAPLRYGQQLQENVLNTLNSMYRGMYGLK